MCKHGSRQIWATDGTGPQKQKTDRKDHKMTDIYRSTESRNTAGRTAGNCGKLLRRAGLTAGLGLIMLGLTACGGSSDETTEAENTALTEAEVSAEQEGTAAETDTSAAESNADLNYEESIAVTDDDTIESVSPYYGIMHVNILDINGSLGDSSTVYSFKDKNDPENAWSVTGLEIGDIEAEMAVGADAVILFHGDVIKDGEGMEFIAVLPEGNYVLRQAEGITLSNTMSSFVVNAAGGELTFLKDNCMIDEGVMNNDSGDRVRVYYADGGELGNYPLRVCGLK